MTTETALPIERPSPSVWGRIVASRRRTASLLAWEVGLPLLVFLGPLLTIFITQCQTYGCDLFIGWDSSTYAWWAVLVQQKGVLTMVLQWNYPHLYVLLLSGFASLLGNLNAAERILPLLVSMPLGYSYYRLTMQLKSDRRLGLLAAFLGGISMGTLEMVSDLQRNLLAFGIALPLGASIYMNLFAGRATPKNVWRLALAVWLPLLLVILGTQIETYGVLAIALLLASVLSRRWSTVLKGVALVAVPVVLLLPLMLPFLFRYGAETSKLLPFGPSDIIAWTWLYLSGLAIPLVGLGIWVLIGAARSKNPIARYLVLWLIALAVLVPPAVALHAPPTRLLFFVPVPLLLAIAAPVLGGWVSMIWTRLRTGWEQPALSRPTPRTESSPTPSASRRIRWSPSLLVAVLLVATPIVVTTMVNKWQLRPYVTEADTQRLAEAGTLVVGRGYRDPIIVLYGEQASLFAPIYRAYFGMKAPDNLAYYGKLQFLFSLPDPAIAYTWKYNPTSEESYSTNYRGEMLASIGPSGIASRPIVLAGGATYSGVLSEPFLARFEEAGGIYVIPPGSLSSFDIDSWRLYAAYDCFVCRQGSPLKVPWSLSPSVLSYVNPTGSETFDAAYALGLVRAWGGGNLTIRFFDMAPSLRVNGGPDVPLAPLEFYFDGNRILTHNYTGLGAISVTLPTGPLSAGIHRVEVKSGSPGFGIALNLDDFELTPSL